MQLKLELLAPAKNTDIGIAAINCGADAVYIAGPSFGAREAAGNSVADIERLARYARIYSAKVYATVNTILYDSETDAALDLIWQLYNAGVDALIIQDLGILKMNLPPMELFASTQTNIRTPEQAKFLDSLGFSRLILERELSLDRIRAIRESVSCDLEFFVHGAMCVSYSGQCYLSQKLAGRSANRGECIQACRSKYDLMDSDGNIILKNRSILSLKDYRLDSHIGELIEAGVSSFKIEGRLKNISYVKNVVRHYRYVIDNYIDTHRTTDGPNYTKSSYGDITGGFSPNPDLTFNRGYTSAFIDGTKGKWNSYDGAKSLGEYLGTITALTAHSITINTPKVVSNGDGLAFVSNSGEISGLRADVCNGNIVTVKDTSGIKKGQKVYRNLNVRFERELEKNCPKRYIDVFVDYRTECGVTTFTALSQDSREAVITFKEDNPLAENKERALFSLKQQIEKISEPFRFNLKTVNGDRTYFYPISFLNNIRRELAGKLYSCPVRQVSAPVKERFHMEYPFKNLSYLANCSNQLSRQLYVEHGVNEIAPAYELSPVDNAELMRTKYCIKYELGLCHRQHPALSPKEPLYLSNTNYKLRVEFDCKKCEMIVLL